MQPIFGLNGQVEHALFWPLIALASSIHPCPLGGEPRIKAADARLVHGVRNILTRRERLCDIERSTRKHEEERKEGRADHRPINELAASRNRKEVEGPPKVHLAEVVRMARVRPQPGLDEATLVLTEWFFSTDPPILFALEIPHLLIRYSLAKKQQQKKQRRDGVEPVERRRVGGENERSG